MLFVLMMFIIFLLINLHMSRYNVVPHYGYFINAFAFSMGFFLTGNDLYWLAYLGLIIEFSVVSYIPYHNYLKKYRNNGITQPVKFYKFNRGMFWLVILLIAYHYIAGGIPALSSNVSISRFDNTSSGLFGIPGRMALFGRYFILFYASYFYFNSRRITQYKGLKKYFIIAVVVNVIYAFFSGSKSSVFALIYTLIYVMAFMHKNINIRRFFKPKLFIGIGLLTCLAFGYFYYYFITYNNQFTSMGFWNYFFYRITNMSVEAGDYALRHCNEQIYYYEDFLYYFQKYFHLHLFDVQSLEVYISCAINHISFTNAYAFYVPITLGLIPEFIYHFGLFCVVPTAILGYLFGGVFVKIKNETNPIKYMNYCFSIYFFIDLIIKGNLMYHLINWLLMLGLMKFLELGGKYLNFRVRKTNNIWTH